MRRFRFFVLLAAVAAFVGTQAATPPPARAASGPPQIAIVTSLGTIDVVLDPAHAPITVRNFLRLVDRKFFDGGTFFRSVPGFVIQGGNKARESERDTPIALEPPAKTGLRNLDGAIAMARTSDPNSATSEFFIDDGDQPMLDQPPGYAAFGHVTKNMDLVRKIARLPAQDQMLLQPVKIIRIRRI
ncbi:MAG: peptidylprolyl isomerase [Candidatus Lustribacter sp.]|jgi:peptidyl-prolyl cis-trans isomerase A (cyclophilin A)